MELIGRVGRDPVFRVTRKGTPIARFQLNTNWQGQESVWNQIVAFNERAKLVEEQVRRGQIVAVKGYVNDRIQKMADGEEHTAYEVRLAWFSTTPKLPGNRPAQEKNIGQETDRQDAG